MIKHALSFASLLGAFAVAGCDDGAGEEFVKAAQKYEADACACKDVACTTKANEDHEKASKALEARGGSVSEEQVKKATEATIKASTCIFNVGIAPTPGVK